MMINRVFLSLIILLSLISISFAFDPTSVIRNTVKPSVNCSGNKAGTHVFSGLTIVERFQKLYDGSFEKYYSQKHDTMKKQSKKKDDSFFSGLTVSERFQKLYDGSYEKYYSQKHDTIKKQNYMESINSDSTIISKLSGECLNKFKKIPHAKGSSISERLQKLYDGSLEKEIFNNK